MSIATVTTLGYGTFGSVADVVTLGYSIGAVSATPASRTLAVLFEDRALDIEFEDRALAIH